MSVVDSLKRLERAGSKDSAQTAKLVGAVEALAAHLGAYIPEDETLPRDYRLVAYTDYSQPVGGAKRREWHLQRWDYDHQRWEGTNWRESALLVARDVATGWLGELAAWLEERTTQDTTAVETLKSAARTNPIL